MGNLRFHGVVALLLTAAAVMPSVTSSSTSSPASVPDHTYLRAAALPAPYAPPWTWPLDPEPEVLRSFAPPARRWLSGHRGVDLAAGGGAPVLAPAAGRVVFAGRVVDRGVLTIDHGGGLKSSFEPVYAAVAAGALVARGSLVGTVSEASEAQPAVPGGAGAHCGRICLHWGVRLAGEYVNPLNYVSDRRPSVLLPVR